MNSEELIPDKEYKKILESVPICCVDIVVRNKEGEILLIRRKNEPMKNLWWFPGGRVYKGEKLHEAAIRKVYEETGLKVAIEKELGVYETIFENGPFHNLGGGVHTVNITFTAKPIKENSRMRLDENHADFKWISNVDEDLHPHIKKILVENKIFT